MSCYREVKALVMSEIESLGKEYQLKYYEQVKVSPWGRSTSSVTTSRSR
jgi:hypothetical protein